MKIVKIKIKYKKEKKGDIDDQMVTEIGLKCPICGEDLEFSQYYQSIACSSAKHPLEISLKNFLNGVLKDIIRDNAKDFIVVPNELG